MIYQLGSITLELTVAVVIHRQYNWLLVAAVIFVPIAIDIRLSVFGIGHAVGIHIKFLFNGRLVRALIEFVKINRMILFHALYVALDTLEIAVTHLGYPVVLVRLEQHSPLGVVDAVYPDIVISFGDIAVIDHCAKTLVARFLFDLEVHLFGRYIKVRPDEISCLFGILFTL